MGFLDRFRRKGLGIEEAIGAVGCRALLSAKHSWEAFDQAYSELRLGGVDSTTRFGVRCEWHWFFIHLMDMYAFAELGPEGRDLLVDCAVNASLDWMTQGMFPENWQSVKTDLLEVFNQRQSEYGARANIFASDWDAVVARGGVPGVSDALSDNPVNKVSWLCRVLKDDVLDGYAPGSVDATPKVRSTADTWGIGLEGAYSLECFLAVQTAAIRGLAEGKMARAIRENRRALGGK